MGQKKMPGLFKRGELWHIDKQVSGRRIQCSTGAKDRKEAEQFLVHLLDKERQSRVYGEPVRYTFIDAATRYVEEETKKSLDRDIQDLKIVMPFIGDLELRKIHIGTLQPFIDKRKKLGIKSATVNRSLSVVRSVLRRAASVWRDDNSHPWLLSVPEIPKQSWGDQRSAYPISSVQEALLMCFLSDELKQLAIWLLNTGLRSQELLNLRWSWRRYVQELDVYVFDIPGKYTKNKQDRVLVLNSLLQTQLGRLVRDDSDLVFPGKGGKKRDRILTTSWKTARSKAADELEALNGRNADWGFRHLRVHDLRHTFATRLRRFGVSIEVRKDLLAHANSDITTHYSASELRELLEAVERLVEDKNLSPITPLEQKKVLQFPYIDTRESSKKVAKSLI
ncbi:tyrosine-type recombinase/integrase [Porticoccaceae bacterium]|nr:tyrosine-type recombinase/integrase [Porticoccaceae bacterium]